MLSLSPPFLSSMLTLRTGISTACSALSLRQYLPASPLGHSVGIAALLASFSIVVAVCLLIIEQRPEPGSSTALLRIQKLALPLAVIAAVVLFFDFSLTTDALHYLTNIGPALHLMSGGTLMVDAFSQYGPGPVLLTYLAFQLGQPSFVGRQHRRPALQHSVLCPVPRHVVAVDAVQACRLVARTACPDVLAVGMGLRPG